MKSIDGRHTTLGEFRGQVLLIVNVASRCSLTPQYAGLEAIYKQHHDRGLSILGFPCNQFAHQEPGDETAIQQFCSLTYNVSFPMFAKIDVNGANTHPLYQFLKSQRPGFLGTKSIKWNFTKFLVDRSGQVVKRFAPQSRAKRLERVIAGLL